MSHLTARTDDLCAAELRRIRRRRRIIVIIGASHAARLSFGAHAHAVAVRAGGAEVTKGQERRLTGRPSNAPDNRIVCVCFPRLAGRVRDEDGNDCKGRVGRRVGSPNSGQA